MNSDVEVNKSSIEGSGAFAKRDFQTGETVLVWDTSHVVDNVDDVPASEKDFLVRFQGNWIIMQEPMRFVNHSCEPSTRSNNGKDIAARTIMKGEEITSDYRPEMKAGEHMECHCGAKSCKGFIIGTGA